MYGQVERLLVRSQKSMDRSLLINIVLSVVGVVVSILLVGALIFGLFNINKFKVEVLSIFLEITEREITVYSEKTENFLVTLHVDDSN